MPSATAAPTSIRERGFMTSAVASAAHQRGGGAGARGCAGACLSDSLRLSRLLGRRREAVRGGGIDLAATCRRARRPRPWRAQVPRSKRRNDVCLSWAALTLRAIAANRLEAGQIWDGLATIARPGRRRVGHATQVGALPRRVQNAAQNCYGRR